MSDDVGGVDLTKNDTSGESAEDDETANAGIEVIDTPGEQSGQDAWDETVEAADTVEAGVDDTVEAGVDDATEVAAVSVADAAETGRRTTSWRRAVWQRQITVKPIPVILLLLVLISGGAMIWLYFKYYLPQEQTNQRVARAAISAASDGTVSVLSYSADSLDKDFAAARSHLSGDFLSYYDQFTQQYVAPAAKQKSLKTTARVVRAAMQELHPTSATVLVFVDQSTTSKDSPEPAMAARSVLVNLVLVDGKWMITKFEPV